MDALGIAALVLYVIGFLRGFVATAGWIAVDEARQAEAGNRTSPNWLNGAMCIIGGLAWPVVAVGAILGWLYKRTVAG